MNVVSSLRIVQEMITVLTAVLLITNFSLWRGWRTAYRSCLIVAGIVFWVSRIVSFFDIYACSIFSGYGQSDIGVFVQVVLASCLLYLGNGTEL